MTSSPPSARIEWLDAAKGACLILVVLYHTVVYIFLNSPLSDTISFQAWKTLVVGLGWLRMPLFFLISGFLAHSAVFNRNWRDVFQPRIATFLWIYLLWMSIELGFRAFLIANFDPALVPGNVPFPLGLDDIVRHALVGDTPIWYLYALVIYFVVCKLGSRHIGLTFALIALLAVFYKQVIPTQHWNLLSLAGNAIFFAAGCYGKAYVERLASQFNGMRFSLACVSAIGLLALGRHYDAMGLPGANLVVAACLVIAAIDFFTLLARRYQLKLLCTLGRHTLSIYLLSFFIINIAAQLISPLQLPVLFAEAFVLFAPPALVALNAVLCIQIYSLLNCHLGRILFSLPSRALTK
ncbi:acyltransferase family protein [Azotobacter chroococcum]|uniref:acyltransferase family protein n=1 Tax=Azotobacter chroococcum TaxID=353 RepID=UPI00146AEFA0|nr:acyltransferase family protein [Azotobacter chroococcum]